jgi:hypothetical protein
MIMLFYKLVDMPHLSGRQIILLTNTFVRKKMRNKLFVLMENFWDLLFEFMKQWTSTLHVAFIFLFRVD